MSEPPPRRPQGPYPPPEGYGPPGGRGPGPRGGYGPPQGPPQGPPPGYRQGPPPQGYRQGPPSQRPPQRPPQGSAQGPPRQPPYQGSPPDEARPPRREPPKKRSTGKVVAVVVVVLLVLGGGGYALWKTVLRPSTSADVASDGSTGTDGPGVVAGSSDPSTACHLVADLDVPGVLGGNGWTILNVGTAVTRVYDSRVLTGVPDSCDATDSLNEKLARIAVYKGDDATAKFAAEKKKASSGGDKGPYLGKVVQAGDEAFCTTGNKTATAGSSAGALVRTGDTLVYVSTTAAGEDDAANCDLSVKLGAKVHAP